MQLKKLLLIALSFLCLFAKADAQNLLKYETLIISIGISGPATGDFYSTPAHIYVDKGRFVYPQKVNNIGASNPSNFELQEAAPVNSVYSKASQVSVIQATTMISGVLNNMGYSLKSTITTRTNPQTQNIEGLSLVFEKATSYREEELYKLLGQLNEKIDTTAKNYIEKAKTEIYQNILGYLKGIPDEMLAKGFKDQLLKALSLEIDDKLKKMKEEILLEMKKP